MSPGGASHESFLTTLRTRPRPYITHNLHVSHERGMRDGEQNIQQVRWSVRGRLSTQIDGRDQNEVNDEY